MAIDSASGGFVNLLEIVPWIWHILFWIVVIYSGYVAVAITLLLQSRTGENAVRLLIAICLHVLHTLMFVNPVGVYYLFYGARLWIFLAATVVLCAVYGVKLILRILGRREQDRRLAIHYLRYFKRLEIS